MIWLLLGTALAVPPACSTSSEVEGGDGWCLSEAEVLDKRETELEADKLRGEVQAFELYKVRMEDLLGASTTMQTQACEAALDLAAQPVPRERRITPEGVALGAGVAVAAIIAGGAFAGWVERPVVVTP